MLVHAVRRINNDATDFCDPDRWQIRCPADLVHAGLLPAGPRLQLEDRRRDRLAAFAGGLAIEVLGDLGVGLYVPGVELVAVVLAQRLGIDAVTRAMSISGTP